MLTISKYLITLFIGLNLLLIYTNIFNEKLTLKEKAAILISIAAGVVISLLTYSFLIILIGIVVLTCFSYFKTRKITYSITIAAISVLLFLTSDAIVNMFFYNLNFQYTASLTGVLLYISMNLGVSFTLAYILGKSFDFVLQNKKIINFKSKIMLIINIAISFTLILAYYSLCKVYMGFQGGIIEIIIFILLVSYIISSIITNILITKNYKEQMETAFYKENLDRIQEYSSTIESMYTDLRKFKHDYVNILISLNEYIEKEDIQGLKKYFNNNIIKTKDIIGKTDSISKLSNIKIIPIKALVSSKLIKSENLGIKTNAEVEELYDLKIDNVDITRILGIALDNAIEGALESEEKFLNFGIIYKGNSVLFIIENSCKKDIPPIFKLMENGFSTKGYGRGLGLNNLKDIMSKYNNASYNLENQNGVFKVELWFRC